MYILYRLTSLNRNSHRSQIICTVDWRRLHYFCTAFKSLLVYLDCWPVSRVPILVHICCTAPKRAQWAGWLIYRDLCQLDRGNLLYKPVRSSFYIFFLYCSCKCLILCHYLNPESCPKGSIKDHIRREGIADGYSTVSILEVCNIVQNFFSLRST